MIPETLIIGPHTFSVTNDRHLFESRIKQSTSEHSLGGSANDHCLIYISSDQHPSQKIDTLLHEVLHVIWEQCQLGLSESKEERIVSVLSTNLYNLFRYNPLLVTSLTQ